MQFLVSHMVELDFSSFAQKMFESEKPFTCKFQFIRNAVLKIKFQSKSKMWSVLWTTPFFFFSLGKKENTEIGSPSHMFSCSSILIGNILKQCSFRKENTPKNIYLGPQERKVKWQNWWCGSLYSSDREDSYSKVSREI